MAQRRGGRQPESAKRAEFARLIACGVSVAEACRLAGVSASSGWRWRHGRTVTASSGRRLHYPPVIERPSYQTTSRFLSEDERIAIADLHRAGHGVRQIATMIGRHPSTVSRELRRNRDPASGCYRPFHAQRLATARRARPRPGKLAGDPVLRQFVADRLERRWSPEQICSGLPAEFPDSPARQVVPETIYQAIYRPDLSGLRRDLPPVLRSGRRRRKPHRRPDARRRGQLVGMTMIAERPAEAADRRVPGHWEGDLILGAGGRSAIGTLVERSSRCTLLLHLPAGRHGADAVRTAVIGALAPLPAALRRSLTWDQGKEMARHDEISAALGLPVFFCEKASPWQRPSNENTNGLLRQYFPKGTDLRGHGPELLAAVAAELNARPRKVLGWDTPAARLAAAAASRG